MIKVLIADDIQILRRGLKAILEQDPDIRVTGLAGDGREAFLLCQEEKPDVVLMDMRMPKFDGAYGIRCIKEEMPEVKILVLTTFDDRETVEEAVASGADGYLLKEMEDAAVIRSVKAVCMGVKIFGDSVFRSMRESAAAGALSPEGEGQGSGGAGSRGPGDMGHDGTGRGGRGPGSEGPGSKAPASLPPNIPGLTDRERDILRLLAQGMDNREIARALYLAEGTVRNNVSRLLEKLELKDRTQLAVFAVKNNLD